MDADQPAPLFSGPCPVASNAANMFRDTTAAATHCDHCDRKVAILAGKSLLEIAAHMKAHPSSCVVIGGKLGYQHEPLQD